MIGYIKKLVVGDRYIVLWWINLVLGLGRLTKANSVVVTRDFGAWKWWKSGSFLRDGIASGRGVHRKMGVWIQKTRSNFGLKSGKLPKIGIFGVGVV